MECFPEREIPVLAALVRQFAVMVNWHASVPGETWPNRQFAHAATSHGTANIEPNFYSDKTIFELLEQADPARSWGVYHDGVAQVWAYDRLWSGGVENFHTINRLHADIRADRLPSYAFVEPNHGYGRGDGNSQHPSHNTFAGDSFMAGEALIGEIYNSLVARPEVFAKTLFLVTYDEHGGFFDHVPPRAVARPDEFIDPESGFDFSICGVRVPAVAISPLIPAGTVDTTFYEHASIAATVRRQFAPSADPLNPRDAAAADVLDHLPLLAEPRQDLVPVEISANQIGSAETTGPKALDAFQASLVDLAGAVRIAREGGRLESLGPPTYVPDPSTRLAAETAVYVPGSPADRVVEDVVADFAQESDGPV
jgi:phospholipase C